jgi:hypothetical protein
MYDWFPIRSNERTLYINSLLIDNGIKILLDWQGDPIFVGLPSGKRALDCCANLKFWFLRCNVYRATEEQ